MDNFQKLSLKFFHKRNLPLIFLGVFLFSHHASAFAAVRNVLGNPGFEEALGGANASGNWNSEANRGISRVTTGAPSGTGMIRLSEPGTVDAGFAGIFTFQTVSGVAEGDIVAFSGLGRVNANNGGEVAQLRIEFQTGAGALISAVNASLPTAVTTSFSRYTASGTAPAGTKQVVFVLRIEPSTSGQSGGTFIADFDDMEASVGNTPLFFEASPTTASVAPGTAQIISMRLHNVTGDALRGVEVVVEPPAGIQVQERNGSLDNQRGLPSREGSVIFQVGTLAAGQESIFSFPVVLSSIIVPGKSYDISAFARASTGLQTERIRILIRAELDPVFDEGTIIGKVFNDLNQNGIQDGCKESDETCNSPEKGIPWVRLVTEEGIIVVTDEHGRYHIPAVKPGRHIVKIDGHTLPQGTKFITEESFLVKTTPGMLNKANFAVLIPPSELPKQFEKELMVSVTQGLDMSRPSLEVTIEPPVLRLGHKKFQTNPIFKFSLNYPEYVKNWFLEIRDEMGRLVWSGFGLGAPPHEVSWTGETESGDFINPGVYSYQLKIEDPKGLQDWTPLYFFRVVTADKDVDKLLPMDIPPVGDFNIFKDGKRSIPLVAKPTIQVQGKTQKDYEIKINDYPVQVDPDTGMFQTQIYATPGEKEIKVTATSPAGESTMVRKKIKVKDSTFFMVALGEQQLGTNFNRGNIEAVGRDAEYKEGFYEDGRLSYYLKGKLKGKFLVKSHYDTDDKRSALFRNLDQDDYYPIYGDHSVRDYEALDTEDRFYMVVEWDRSFVKYGSFKTNFTETELSRYNRTLSGLKVHHESIQTTAYGDPKRGVKLYWSEARHKADHNEFLATGGSLYYLRNRLVIEGSEKIRVEIRDRIQDIPIESIDLQEGADYEIDYAEGRLLLNKPLSSIAASDTLVSHDILDGNPVYLIIDYEYDAGHNAFEDTNRGIRGYTHMGDHIRIGATGVEEKRQSGDHDLRGVDLQVKVGRNTKVIAEYAETHLQQTNTAVSFNGGLSFANLEPLRSYNAQPRENAYLIKAESKPIDKLETTGYLQGIDPGFSNDISRSQEGFRKYGISSRYRFSDDFYLRYRYDASDIQNELLPLPFTGIRAPYERLRTNTVQAVFDNHQWLAEAEYRKQEADIPSALYVPTFLSEIPFDDGIAVKLGYHLNDRLLPYVKAQAGFNDKPNHQFGAGVRYQILNNLYGYLEQMVGNIGDSTRFGFEKYQNASRYYAGMKMLDFGRGVKNIATNIGSSHPLSDRDRIYTEREFSSYQSQEGFADIMGYDKQINDNWSFEAKGERRHLDNASTRLLDQQAEQSLGRVNSYIAVSGGVAYKNSNKLKARTALEYRRDTDNPDLSQWLTKNNVEYQINQDLGFLGKLNFGRSRFLNPGDTAASFTELSTGFAYRPVDHDRLNVLTRYTLLRNIANDFQFASALFNGVESDQTDHIFAIDLAYEWFKLLGTVEKFAYKTSTLNSNLANEIIVHNMLMAHRFNFHVTKKWDVALEYRALWQFDALNTLKHGFLTEVDREIYDYVRLGLGYNFTDFDDDLRHDNNFKSHGPFVRMTGKF